MKFHMEPTTAMAITDAAVLSADRQIQIGTMSGREYVNTDWAGAASKVVKKDSMQRAGVVLTMSDNGLDCLWT
jgi:hypothetical protein